MTVGLYILGILLMLIGVSISIALHEVGHLLPAKRFGVKVTRYMVGFGPTLFSRRRGETEYGIKLLPLGGYIAMPGMFPPLPEGKTQRRMPFSRAMIEARAASNEELEPGEEHRAFYALSVPKRLVIMFGGPFVNLVLGIGIMAIALLGIGVSTPTTTIASVSECAVPASQAAQRSTEELQSCQPEDVAAPAWDSGLVPGDDITAIAGQPVEDWDQLSAVIREHAGERVRVDYEREGVPASVEVTIIPNERYVFDDRGRVVEDADGNRLTETVGFLGISPVEELRGIPVSEFPGEMAFAMGQIFKAIVFLPARLVDIAQVAVGSQERDPEGPLGLVGVGRIAGEIVSTDRYDVASKAQMGLGLLGSLNLFLFAFNMVPLLPLDGGHIATALYEGARRRINLLRGRGFTGPFDTAKLLPLTYAVVLLFLGMTVLLAYVDIVNPIRLFGD